MGVWEGCDVPRVKTTLFSVCLSVCPAAVPTCGRCSPWDGEYAGDQQRGKYPLTNAPFIYPIHTPLARTPPVEEIHPYHRLLSMEHTEPQGAVNVGTQWSVLKNSTM